MVKKARVLYKTPQKPIGYYKAMSKPQLEKFRVESIVSLHQINEGVKKIWNNRAERTLIDQMVEEDRVLTSSGAYDKHYRSDVFTPNYV